MKPTYNTDFWHEEDELKKFKEIVYSDKLYMEKQIQELNKKIEEERINYIKLSEVLNKYMVVNNNNIKKISNEIEKINNDIIFIPPHNLILEIQNKIKILENKINSDSESCIGYSVFLGIIFVIILFILFVSSIKN